MLNIGFPHLAIDGKEAFASSREISLVEANKRTARLDRKETL